MSATGGGAEAGRERTEEELRAAYEEEMKKIRVEQIVLEHVVTLINLGMRRTGLAPGTEGERDPGQVRLAIESVRGQLPLVEQITPEQVKPIRDALSQLQLAYVRIGGQPIEEAAAATAQEPAPAGATPGSKPGGMAGSETGQAQAGQAGAGQPQPPREGAPSEQAPGSGEGPGPAQRSGRLWVPGR